MLGLKYNADLRTFAFAGLYVFVVAYRFFCVPPEPILLRILLFFATVLLSFQGAITVHNAIHCPIFHSKKANLIFQVFLSLWFGHSASAYVPGHNLSHHKYLQSNKDFQRTTNMRYKWHLLNLLLFVPSLINTTNTMEASYFAAQKKLGRPIYRQMRIEMTAYWALQVTLAVLGFWRWIEIFLIPQLIGKYLIITINILQHDGCDPLDKYNNSRNFTDPLLNFLVFNNGYHTIHHLYPGKHWSLLKDEHDRKVKPFIHPSLEQKSMLDYLFRTFIFPAVRLTYDGQPLVLPPDDPMQPWFYEESETYSSEQEYTIKPDLFRSVQREE